MEQNLAPDVILGLLVEAINQVPDDSTGPGVGLTLNVGGVVISGRLISNWQWTQLNRDSFAESSPNGFSKLLDEVLVSMKESRDEIATARTAAEALPQRYRNAVLDQDHVAFIHLTEARIYIPGQPGMPGNGLHWRGRLSEVGGWSFGVFNQEEA